jgi:hypothetical protein
VNVQGSMPRLAVELRRRVGCDQEVRQVGGKTAADLSRWREVDEGNRVWLWTALREYGWLGRLLVGDQGCGDAAVLAQHADGDRRLQQYSLALLIEAVDRGDAEPVHVGYLTDRICLHAGIPTRYGTQYACGPDGRYRMLPVVDCCGLEVRRARLGLPRVAEFERQFTELHAGRDVLDS